MYLKIVEMLTKSISYVMKYYPTNNYAIYITFYFKVKSQEEYNINLLKYEASKFCGVLDETYSLPVTVSSSLLYSKDIRFLFKTNLNGALQFVQRIGAVSTPIDARASFSDFTSFVF